MTDALALVQASILPEQLECEEIATTVKDFIIRDPSDYEFAAEAVREVKHRLKDLEAKRVYTKAPALEQGRRIDELFRPTLDYLQTAEASLKRSIATYTTDQERLRQVTMQASAAVYQAGGYPTAVIPAPPVAQGVTTVQVLDWEIQNPDLIPRELCSPDPAKILARVKAIDADRHPDGVAKASIPGVRMFHRPQVRVTA